MEYHEGAGSEYTRSLTRGSTGSVVIESSTYPRLSNANSGMYMNLNVEAPKAYNIIILCRYYMPVGGPLREFPNV